MLDDELRLWAEWEAGSKGRRQQVWSRGMRDKLQLGAELSDEEVAELEVDGQDLVAIDSSEWRRACEVEPGLEHHLRVVIRSSSSLEDARSRVTEFLSALGVRHRPIWPVS